MGLLVIFRDRGLDVPSIALLLDFFSIKDAAEGFLYISKRSSAKLIIRTFHLRTSTRRNVISLSVAFIGSTIPLTDRTHLAFLSSGLPPRTYVSSPSLWFFLVFKGHRIFLTLLWSRGIQVLDPISAFKTRR